MQWFDIESQFSKGHILVNIEDKEVISHLHTVTLDGLWGYGI